MKSCIPISLIASETVSATVKIIFRESWPGHALMGNQKFHYGFCFPGDCTHACAGVRREWRVYIFVIGRTAALEKDRRRVWNLFSAAFSTLSKKHNLIRHEWKRTKCVPFSSLWDSSPHRWLLPLLVHNTGSLGTLPICSIYNSSNAFLPACRGHLYMAPMPIRKMDYVRDYDSTSTRTAL